MDTLLKGTTQKQTTLRENHKQSNQTDFSRNYPPKKEPECVCNANIHSEGSKITRAAAKSTGSQLQRGISEKEDLSVRRKTQSDCEEASVRNLCVVTMVTETKRLRAKSEAVSKHALACLGEAAASSAVKQQVRRHTSELQTLQSHSDAALSGG